MRHFRRDSRQELGCWGEKVANDYLIRTLGWSILHRNWRRRQGEIDLVAQSPQAIVIVEVRARVGENFGTPLESVGSRKRRQLLRITSHYLASWGVGESGTAVRIDVIALWAQIHSEGYVAERFVHVRDAVHL